ncbi:MAG: tripartite tricarboxylate transporter TctB family protein [Geminicoccaceae bacterium]
MTEARSQQRMILQDRVLNILLIAVFAAGSLLALGFSQAGRLFPLTVSIVGLLLSVLQLVLSLRGSDGRIGDNAGQVEIAADTDTPPELFRARLTRFLIWCIALFAGIWLLGFKIAVPLYMALYLRIEARAKIWLIALLVAASVYLLFFHFSEILGVVWPEPLIARYIELPAFLQ